VRYSRARVRDRLRAGSARGAPHRRQGAHEARAPGHAVAVSSPRESPRRGAGRAQLGLALAHVRRATSFRGAPPRRRARREPRTRQDESSARVHRRVREPGRHAARFAREALVSPRPTATSGPSRQDLPPERPSTTALRGSHPRPGEEAGRLRLARRRICLALDCKPRRAARPARRERGASGGSGFRPSGSTGDTLGRRGSAGREGTFSSTRGRGLHGGGRGTTCDARRRWPSPSRGTRRRRRRRIRMRVPSCHRCGSAAGDLPLAPVPLRQDRVTRA